jgi:hypothetical protein
MKHLKTTPNILLFLGWVHILFLPKIFFTQEPGANQDFGKYHKKIQFDTNFIEGGGYQLELINPIKKLPKDKNWSLFKEDGTNFKNIDGITIHPSRTFLGDTTSVSYKGEYIEHRPNPYSSDVVPFSYYSDFVTNKDWNVFRAYVRDSTARRILTDAMGPEEWLISSLDNNRNSIDESILQIDWKKRNLNFNKNVNNSQFPFLAELMYSESDAFYEMKLIDERKLIYTYNWDNYQICKKEMESLEKKTSKTETNKLYDCLNCNITENVSLFRDSTFWVKDTSLIHFSSIEDGLCSFYNYHPYFENNPVTSINVPQARAYLKWLEINHQKSLNKENLPYYVVYELPKKIEFSKQQTSIEIPAFNLTPWKITNFMYEEFVNYTRDSIARLILAFEYSPTHYLAPVLDDELQEKHYSYWHLDWRTKIDWENKTGIPYKFEKGIIIPTYGTLGEMYYSLEIGDTNLIDKRKLMLEQYFYDFKTAAITIDRLPTNEFNVEGCYVCDEKQFLESGRVNNKCLRSNGTISRLGKDLNLSNLNRFYESTDVYAHKDRSRFIVKDIINVYPKVNHKHINSICWKGCHDLSELNLNYDELLQYYDFKLCPQYPNWNIIPEEYDFKSNPNALIQDITYHQFVAYWRWRIQKSTLPKNDENPVVSNYIPSEEEFLMIQSGENVMHQEEVHNLPTPTFRYVVKFYPK